MFKVDVSQKKILFQNEYEIDKKPIKTHECELLSAYICPKCEQILLAYFKTEEFIPVWKYDEREKDKSYNSESDIRYYRYRVFYAGCGIMGIELKEHNGYNGCSYKIYQRFNIIESMNAIFKDIENELKGVIEKKKVSIKSLPDNFDKKRLIENLKKIKAVILIPDVCNLMAPLIKLDINSVKYKEIDIYGLKYGSRERKKAELQNFGNMEEAYIKLIERIKQ